jgi:hypothetical protein
MIMPGTFRITAAAGILLLAGAAGPAWAQATRAPAAPDSNPSDKLSQSRGVITPNQDVDPKMQVRPPDPGPTSTPVIPPPGSPGGDPNVVPK